MTPRRRRAFVNATWPWTGICRALVLLVVLVGGIVVTLRAGEPVAPNDVYVVHGERGTWCVRTSPQLDGASPAGRWRLSGFGLTRYPDTEQELVTRVRVWAGEAVYPDHYYRAGDRDVVLPGVGTRAVRYVRADAP